MVNIYRCHQRENCFNVLLVEGNKLLQAYLKHQLEEKGFSVSLAESGEDAVKQFNDAYDLVIMDIDLPGIDGIEAACQIREFYKSSTVPIIAHTAHEDKRTKALCYWAGMNGFIQKGASMDAMSTHIVETSYLNLLKQYSLVRQGNRNCAGS